MNLGVRLSNPPPNLGLVLCVSHYNSSVSMIYLIIIPYLLYTYSSPSKPDINYAFCQIKMKQNISVVRENASKKAQCKEWDSEFVPYPRDSHKNGFLVLMKTTRTWALCQAYFYVIYFVVWKKNSLILTAIIQSNPWINTSQKGSFMIFFLRVGLLSLSRVSINCGN